MPLQNPGLPHSLLVGSISRFGFIYEYKTHFRNIQYTAAWAD